MKKMMWVVLGILVLLFPACHDGGGSGSDPVVDNQQYIDEMISIFTDWRERQPIPDAEGGLAEDDVVREVCEEIRASFTYSHSPERIQDVQELMDSDIGGLDDFSALALITLLDEGVQRKDLYLIASLSSDKDIHICLMANGKVYFTDPRKMDDKLILGYWHNMKITVINDGSHLDNYEWSGVW